MKWFLVLAVLAAWVCRPACLDAQTAVRVTVFLEGAYDSDGGLMRADLHRLNLLPLKADPFYDSVAVPVIPSDDIVDWIQLELRRSVRSYPALRITGFLRRDGRIVGLDGGDLLIGSGELPEGEYYVLVRHRNHLDIISAGAVAFLDHAEVNIDFSSDPSSVPYEKLLTLIDTAREVYGMRTGDIETDRAFNAVDGMQLVRNLDRHGIGYFSEDLNLDGSITLDDVTIFVRNFGYSFREILKPVTTSAADTLTADETADVEVYPVPVTRGDFLKIGFKRSDVRVTSYRILDNGGRAVFQSADVAQPAGRPFFEAPTQELAPGLYLVVLETNRGNFTHKFLVMR